MLSSTPRTRHRRVTGNGRADRADLRAVLAAGRIAHLGVLVDGHPMVVPTVYGFDGPPDDGDSPDAALVLWAGRLPVATTWGAPVPDPVLPAGITTGRAVVAPT